MVTAGPARRAKVWFVTPLSAGARRRAVARRWQRCFVKMQVLCAWCHRDGKPAYLGEREPLENPGLTHGICVSHKEQVLESLPSRSFPDTKLLIVVRQNYIPLSEHFQRCFVSVPGVKVLVDRRATDRRSASYPVTDERRVRSRRIRRGAISQQGSYTVVRFTPKVIHCP
jgi:hypothetical protein